MRTLVMLVGCCSMMWAGPMSADTVYKVIDAQGRVTYTNEPPASKNSTRIDITPANVVPATKPATSSPSPSTDEQLNENLLRERIATERARQEAYQADAERQRAEAERLTAARAECERQRWTRCDDPDFLVEQGWIVPSRVRPPRDRSPGRVVTSPSDRPAPLPPGAIPHRAPADQYTPRAYPPVPKGTPGYP